MTSAITTTNINGDFPIAGQDNNSQGFRDNFTNIKTGLNTAKSEITALQTNTAKLNASNDFNGNILQNAEINQVYGSVRNNGTISVNTDIDIENGPLQIYTLAGSATLQFINWPASDLYARIRLHLKSNTADSSVITVTFATEAGGAILKSGDGAAFPNPFNLNINANFRVVEAWTYDGGSNVFLKYLGEYS